MENTVPVLNFYAGHGYNARKGYFQGEPVFALSHEKGQQVRWSGDGDYRLVPDQISALPALASHTWQDTLWLKNERDYEQEFSGMMRGEYTDVSWTGLNSSSLLYQGRLFSQVGHIYGLNCHARQVMKFRRVHQFADPSLDPQFADAITGLPPALDSQDSLQEYFCFFNTYGTHYVTEGTLGGMIFMETAIKMPAAGNHEPSKIGKQLNLAFHGMLENNAFKASSENFVADLGDNLDQAPDNQIDILGGQYIFDDGISGWVRSIYEMPALLLLGPQNSRQALSSLTPLSTLAGAAGAAWPVAGCMRQALEAYLAPPGSAGANVALDPALDSAAARGLHAHRNFMAALRG